MHGSDAKMDRSTCPNDPTSEVSPILVETLRRHIALIIQLHYPKKRLSSHAKGFSGQSENSRFESHYFRAKWYTLLQLPRITKTIKNDMTRIRLVCRRNYRYVADVRGMPYVEYVRMALSNDRNISGFIDNLKFEYVKEMSTTTSLDNVFWINWQNNSERTRLKDMIKAERLDNFF